MSDMNIYVENKSKHDFVCVGSWGTSLKCATGTIIPKGEKVSIGSIEVPNMFRKGNYGWWYVQDCTNQATFELFASVDPSTHGKDGMAIGLKANCSHENDSHHSPTPNQAPDYLSASRDDQSFMYVIKPEWTTNPPKYIFNFGDYGIKSIGSHTTAAHSFVVVRSFDGGETINFECWGGVATQQGQEPDLDYPAETFLANEYELLLARTICCFDPQDVRTNYNVKPDFGKFEPKGKLSLGDCCGIIYGIRGVCHQMANRICAAVTDADAGDRADMAAYNASHLIWGTYGDGPNPDASSQAYELIHKAFSDVITEDELHKLGISSSLPYPVNLLFQPWEKYLEECKKLVDNAMERER